MEIKSRTRTWEQLSEALRILRVSWLTPVLAFGVLALPAQVLDHYRALAESKNWLQIGLAALLLLVSAILSYRLGRHRALQYMHADDGERPLLRACLRWGPALCASLLLTAAAAGVLFASVSRPEPPKGVDAEIDRILAAMAATDDQLTLVAAAICAVALLFLLLPLLDKRAMSPTAAGLPRPYALTLFERIVLLAIAVAMVSIAFVPWISVVFSQTIGSLAIFLLFLCMLLFALSLLQSLSERQGVPWIALLLVWGMTLAVLDRGEAHRVKLVESPGRGEGLVQLQYAFSEWYRERKDKDAYRNEPYPVYLIAAEAGGLYAALYTAKVLARLQDRCPNFAQHVFAISGVSGGSLGASVFSSLAKKYAQNGPWQPCKVGSDMFERKVQEVLKQDFLSPLVSRAFFADLLQRFLPYPLVVPEFSRGRAFEESVLHAWGRVEGSTGNPFADPFLNHWSPADAGPALMLNTTSVGDGRQIVLAPFGPDIDDPGYHIGYLHLQSALSKKDLTLGSAVSLSGRFPWILPVATIRDSRLALVDGAYYEGSGIETLSGVRNALRPYEVKPATQPSPFPYISVHVIVIGGVDRPVNAADPLAMPILSGPTMDEATPPLRTMLNTRARRGYIAHNTLRDWSRMLDCPPIRPEAALMASVGGGASGGVAPGICPSRPPLVIRLNQDYFGLPLGWALSDGMRQIIDRHAPGKCTTSRTGAPLKLEDGRIDEGARIASYVLAANGMSISEVADQLWAGDRVRSGPPSLPCD